MVDSKDSVVGQYSWLHANVVSLTSASLGGDPVTEVEGESDIMPLRRGKVAVCTNSDSAVKIHRSEDGNKLGYCFRYLVMGLNPWNRLWWLGHVLHASTE